MGWVITTKYEKFEDWYIPADLYGQASMYAKNYCKQHTDADKQRVYISAQEAAEIYERRRLWAITFRNHVLWYIRNELYKHKYKEEILNLELRNSIIADYNSGMAVKEIAERYQIHPHTTHNNLVNWGKRGLVTLRESTPTPDKKPVHIPKAEKEPAPTAIDTSSCEILHTEIITPNLAEVKQIVVPDVAREALLEKYEELSRERDLLAADLQDKDVQLIELKCFIEQVGGSV